MSGGARRPFWRESFQEGFLRKEIAVRVCLALVILAVYYGIRPYERHIQPEDWWHYRYPYAVQESIPAFLATGVLVGAAMLNMPYFLWLVRRKKSSAHMYRHAVYHLLCLSMSLLISVLFCELTKRLYGRLRPDFLSRCFGEFDHLSLVKRSASITDSVPLVCTNPALSQRELDDGRMSFPSEHTATAMAVFVVMALWDFVQFRSIEGYGGEALVLPVFLLMIPLAVALSRTRDYRHHASDIVAGMIVGTTAAVITHVFYYPRRGRSAPGRVANKPIDTHPNFPSISVDYGTEDVNNP